MPRISLRCEVFQFFSDPFSGHVWSLSAFVCICKLFLNVLVFNVWFLKMEKEKKKKKKFCGMGEQWSFKSLRSHFTTSTSRGACENGGGAKTMAASLFVCTDLSVIRSRNQ